MQTIKNILTNKRVKSFLWRLGMMVVATGISFTSSELTSFGFSPQVTVVLGLVLGEVTKYLNTAKKA